VGCGRHMHSAFSVQQIRATTRTACIRLIVCHNATIATRRRGLQHQQSTNLSACQVWVAIVLLYLVSISTCEAVKEMKKRHICHAAIGHRPCHAAMPPGVPPSPLCISIRPLLPSMYQPLSVAGSQYPVEKLKVSLYPVRPCVRAYCWR
jgi:hypothetical protein